MHYRAMILRMFCMLTVKWSSRTEFPTHSWLYSGVMGIVCLPLLLLHGTVQAIPNQPPRPYLVKDIAPGASNAISTQDYRRPLIYAGNTLYVVANNGENGWGLWQSNGATNGTKRLAINLGLRDFTEDTSWLAVNGTLYFDAIDGGKSGLWKSNGTAAGTVLITHYGFGSILQLAEITHDNAVIYFSLYDGVTPVELWKSDGTSAGTAPIITNTYPEQLTIVNSTLYYVESHNVPTELALWKSDGTVGGTVLVRTFTGPSRIDGLDLRLLTEINEVLYFVGYDETHGAELWKSDGTSAGTTLVKDINVGVKSSFIRQFVILNDTLYFSANDGVNGTALWKTDGTTEGTRLLKDINPTASEQSPFPDFASFVPVGNMLYFIANDGARGNELWKSDGTAEGTRLVKDINPGSGDALSERGFAYLTNVNGVLYFAATDGVTGLELWRSDGTGEGTNLVDDIHAGPNDSNPSFLVNGNGTLYFAANNGISGMELWGFNPELTPQVYVPVVLHE